MLEIKVAELEQEVGYLKEQNEELEQKINILRDVVLVILFENTCDANLYDKVWKALGSPNHVEPGSWPE